MMTFRPSSTCEILLLGISTKFLFHLRTRKYSLLGDFRTETDIIISDINDVGKIYFLKQ